jgi:hypothetical protein
MRKKLVHRASGGRQPRRRRWDARQQVLSALHIWSEGQLIKHDEDGYVTIQYHSNLQEFMKEPKPTFLTIAVPGVGYSG